MKGSNRSKQAIALALAALALAVLVTLYSSGDKGSLGWSVQKSPSPDLQTVSATAADLEKMWMWADGELSGGARASSWSLRWSLGRLTQQEAATLGSLLNLMPAASPMPSPLQNTDEKKSAEGILWEASLASDKGKLKLQLLDSGEGDVHEAFLSYSAAAPADAGELGALTSQVAAAAAKTALDIRPLMSIKLYGTAIKAGAAERMASKAGAEPIDEYKDDVTVIRDFKVESISGTVRLGGSGEQSSMANLQLAEHEGAESATEITAGIPLIVGDVSESGAGEK